MPKVKTERISTNYRLSAEGHRIIDSLAKDLGVSRTAVIESAIRQFQQRNALSNLPPLKDGEVPTRAA